jgi:hypothetical protein
MLVVAVFGLRIGWRQAGFSLFFIVSVIRIAKATQTNEQVLGFALEVPITHENANAMDVLVDRFSRELTTSDRLVFDRFSGPAARLACIRAEDISGYDAHEHINGRGANMLGTIGMDSLRIAAVEALPLDTWEDNWLHWLGHLITGSIGNPEEEHAGLTRGSYSAVRSSWESQSKETRVQWGIRPWRTYPYVYILARAGRIEGLPLLTLEGRAGYRFFDAPRVEARLTTQLPASFRIAAGAAFDPTRVGENEYGRAEYAVTLEKVLGPHSPYSDAILFLGFRSGVNTAYSTPRRESVVLAGISTGW